MLKKLRLLAILVCILVGVSLFGDAIPLQAKEFFYALSLSMKQVLLFVIPFIIFSFLFHSLVSQKEGAVLFVALLVTMVYCSNLLAIITSYGVSTLFLGSIGMSSLPTSGEVVSLEPLWTLALKPWFANDHALIAGFAVGIIFFLFRNERATRCAHYCNVFATMFLKRVFIPLLPLFIFGFVVELQHEQVLTQVINLYGPIFGLVVGLQLAYLALYYFVASGFSPAKWWVCIRNILPSAFTGFTSMSSIAAMPVTIIGAEQNTGNSNYAKLIIPATVNIHTIGSAIGIVALTLSTTLALGYEAPTFDAFLKFALFWALAKFAVAAVPGGAVVVAMPLLEKYLGADGSVICLVTAAYTFFDPFGTMTNVSGNGAFAILFSKIKPIRHMFATETHDEATIDIEEGETGLDTFPGESALESIKSK